MPDRSAGCGGDRARQPGGSWRWKTGTGIASLRGMARSPRYVPPHSTVEVTIKTIDDRFLLRPSKELNDVILGILGKALTKYPVLLHAFVVMSNHMQSLLTTPNGRVLAAFMNYVNSKIAREAGRIYNWRARLFARRYRHIVVLDDDAVVDRLRYIMSHGAKEGLVWDPEHWPGANSLPWLVHGETLRGTWYDRSAMSRIRARGMRIDPRRFATIYEVPLAPIPCWRELPAEEYHRRCRGLLDEVREHLAQVFRREGMQPIGAKAVKRQDPLGRPRSPKRGPAPSCHSTSRSARQQYLRQLAEFVGAYRAASARFRAGELDVVFPSHSFPPPRSFVLLEAGP